jgi:hypothetical protein
MGKIESSKIQSSSSSVVLMSKNEDEDEHHESISSSAIKTNEVSSISVDTSVSSIDTICAKQQKVKKEQEEQYFEDDNAFLDSNDIDDYTDWKAGNWCWLLPANNNANTNTNDNHSIEDTQGHTQGQKRNCATTRYVKSEGDNKNNSNSKKEKLGNDDANDEPLEKKLRLVPPPIPLSSSSGSSIDQDQCHDDGHDDDEGYESWTEGNWCLLLLRVADSSPSATAGEIVGTRTKTEPQPHDVVLQPNDENTTTTTTTTRSRARSSSTSHNLENFDDDDEDKNENELDDVDEDELDDDDDDDDYGENNRDDDDDDNDNDDDENNASTRKMKKRNKKNTKKQDERWNKMLQRLVAYKRKYKSTSITQKCEADPKLASWVIKQRVVYSIKELCIERINRLESIGLVWDPYDPKLMEMYGRLVANKRKHKSTIITQKCEADPKLSI